MRGRTSHQKRIDRFMKYAGQDLPDSPTMPEEKVRKLRASLILEEALETIKALGFSAVATSGDKAVVIKKKKVEFFPEYEPDLIEVADGCADTSVVTIGTLSACGIADEAILQEVDLNNLKKFGEGHRIREDGKLLKPPGHQPPNFEKVLLLQGWQK